MYIYDYEKQDLNFVILMDKDKLGARRAIFTQFSQFFVDLFTFLVLAETGNF